MKALLSHLEQQVKDCERRIIKQLEIIDLLTDTGRDTTRAVRLLYELEDAWQLQAAYRDRTRAQAGLD
jgi:hypothetical protein